MPGLFRRDFMGRVKVIEADGNTQEVLQLDIATVLYFNNVCPLQCGWHVVEA
jgi:hypothetical protein